MPGGTKPTQNDSKTLKYPVDGIENRFLLSFLELQKIRISEARVGPILEIGQFWPFLKYCRISTGHTRAAT